MHHAHNSCVLLCLQTASSCVESGFGGQCYNRPVDNDKTQVQAALLCGGPEHLPTAQNQDTLDYIELFAG